MMMMMMTMMMMMMMMMMMTMMMMMMMMMMMHNLSVQLPGTPLTEGSEGFPALNVRRIFLGLMFWPKGIFLGL